MRAISFFFCLPQNACNLFLILALGLSLPSQSTAATFRKQVNIKAYPAIILEGTIEKGDYERLVDQIGGGFVFDIFLASPGGDVTEAMKIGKLIRRLRISTGVPAAGPTSFQQSVARLHSIEDLSNNYLCASACFLIFVAGIFRDSDEMKPMLAIHRPYLSEIALQHMSAESALREGTRMQLEVRDYLKEMNVPDKYADIMMSINPTELRWITSEEYAEDFEGYISDLKDWARIQCKSVSGGLKSAWDNSGIATRKLSDAELEQLATAFERKSNCELQTRLGITIDATANWRK